MGVVMATELIADADAFGVFEAVAWGLESSLCEAWSRWMLWSVMSCMLSVFDTVDMVMIGNAHNSFRLLKSMCFGFGFGFGRYEQGWW